MASNFIRVHSRLKRGLGEPQVVDDYDLVMIDCPPNFGIITRTALVASNGYFVPTKPDYLSTLGLHQLQRHVSQLVTDYNWYLQGLPVEDTPIAPQPLGVIFNMVKPYDRQPIQDQRVYINEVRNSGIHVLEQMPRENNRYYSRQTDDRVPLVLQDEDEPMFVEKRTELQMLAREACTILNIP